MNAIRKAISDLLADVQFVSLDEADELTGEDFRVDDGRGVLISVAQIRELAANVVAVDVGVTSSHGSYLGQTIQFKWDGTSWNPADPDDTGVTVTSSVS